MEVFRGENAILSSMIRSVYIIVFLVSCFTSSLWAQSIWDDPALLGDDPNPAISSSDAVASSSSERSLSSAIENSSSSLQVQPGSLPKQPAIMPVLPSPSEKSELSNSDSSFSQGMDSAVVDTPIMQSSSPTESVASEAQSIAKEKEGLQGVRNAQEQQSLSNENADNTDSSYARRRKMLGAINVSRVRSIDGLDEYRSPRKALFLSLMFPGAGQYYVGGGVGTYVRGALYSLIEVGTGVAWYYYTVKQYNEQVEAYESYARNNFSLAAYEQNLKDVYQSIDDDDRKSEFALRYLSGRESYCETLYGLTHSFNCSDLESTDGHESNFSGDNLGEELDNLNGVYDSRQLYLLIGDEDYVGGWEDAEMLLMTELMLNEKGQYVALGTSDKQIAYQEKRLRATELADMRTVFLGALLLNHIVSALDAALSASAHNKALYQEEISWYERLQWHARPLASGRSVLPGVQAVLSF
jgi:hypothetical protein